MKPPVYLFAAALLPAAIVLAPAAIPQSFEIPAPPAADSRFNCEGGRSLSMRFGSLNGESIAAVTAEGRRHVLALQPWDGGLPQVVWSDGSRTLTWDVGVKLLWQDGAQHYACGRRGVPS